MLQANLIPHTYISKEDSTYLKGWAILIMIFLHAFGSRAAELSAYSKLDDIIDIHGYPISYYISKFCSICVHLYILLSGYGLYITYRRKKDTGTSMHTIQRIAMLLAKVLLVGCIFYPVSLLYPQLNWNLSHVFQLLLGYEGNYEWWFLRPYIVIASCSFPLLAAFDKRPDWTLCISLVLYCGTKGILYKEIHVIPMILQQIFILSPAFFLGAALAKWGILAKASGISSQKKCRIIAWSTLILMVLYKSIFPAGLFDFILSAVFVICMMVTKGCTRRGGVGLLIKIGEEATAMWLIHTFIAIYYWSNLTFSLRYPLAIFVFIVLSSYIFSKFIAIPYATIKNRLNRLFA